jgi:hypothetical protein
MANLVYYDKNHKYEVDGEEYPSISEICRFIAKEIYDDLNQFKVDSAGDRGSNVHKATELIDKYGSAEIKPSIAPYINAYIQFLQDYEPNWTAIEKAYASEEYKFAGTLDRLGFIKNELAIVDIKTDSTIGTTKKEYYKVKMNAYKILVEENENVKVQKLYLLHLKNDGTYGLKKTPLIELEQDNSIFMACLKIHNIFRKKSKSKRESEEQTNES